jgi:hypothetical protein
MPVSILLHRLHDSLLVREQQRAAVMTILAALQP